MSSIEELANGVYLLVDIKSNESGEGLAKLRGVRRIQSMRPHEHDHLLLRIDEPETTPGEALKAIRAILAFGTKYPFYAVRVTRGALVGRGKIGHYLTPEERKQLVDDCLGEGIGVPNTIAGMLLHSVVCGLRREENHYKIIMENHAFGCG